MKKLFGALIMVAAILAMVISPVMADTPAPSYVAPRWVQTGTFYNPGPTSTAGTVTTYSGPAYGGANGAALMNYVSYWSVADVFVTGAFTSITGTGILTVTPQFSADNINWREAQYVTISGSVISMANIAWSLSTTDTVGYPIPIQGEFMRFRIDVTNGVSTTVTPLVRVTLKTYGVGP